MDKPFYLRSEFWVMLIGAAPSSITFAEAFLKPTTDGTLDPNDPLYQLFVKVGGSLMGLYVIGRSIKKAVDAYRASAEIQG